MIRQRSAWLCVAVAAVAGGCKGQVQGPELNTVGSSASSAAAPATPITGSGESASSAAAAALTRVSDRSLICMVNNQFMGRPQIPIEVAGRTYYGCCEMCKTRLGTDPSSRSATDPVSGRTVDKAIAIIGKTGDGRALYFENEQTFAAYTPGAAK